MADKPIMAQSFADAIGATKRQVQFWTDRGAVKCIPETDQQGRGKQRHYDEAEIPIARLVAQMGAFQLPIGTLVWFSNLVRHMLQNGDKRKGIPGGRPASWYRGALAGKYQSFIVLRPNRESFIWADQKQKDQYSDHSAVFTIPVHEVRKRIPR